jgi:diguanylate cyclase (GGDEF)-like protein
MAFTLPLAFLCLQLLVLWAGPASIRPVAAHAAMVLGPLCAGLVCVWRARQEPEPARGAWRAAAMCLGLWTIGMVLNFWHEQVEHSKDVMYPDAMLAFNLSDVPLVYLLASAWQRDNRSLVRWVDGAVALALGVAYYQLNWKAASSMASVDQISSSAIIWLLDVLNVYITFGALVRWRAAEVPAERDFFKSLALYSVCSLVLVNLNNHWIANNPAFGPEASSAITASFALLAYFALRRPAQGEAIRVSPALVLTVRGASSMMMAGTLLIVSLVLMRVDYPLGVAGVLVAVLGHWMRSTVDQVSHIMRGDAMQRLHSELQTIARTDALTGVANRHFLRPALDNLWRMHRHDGRPLAVLMIDVDHFKQFNDRHGHPAGDACLRDVATALQRALVRPGDVLARYGGEEFIALLHDVDAAAAGIVGERLRAAVQALQIPHTDSPHAVVTASVGTASTHPAPAPLPVASAAELVAAADLALYRAKQGGRNQVSA